MPTDSLRELAEMLRLAPESSDVATLADFVGALGEKSPYTGAEMDAALKRGIVRLVQDHFRALDVVEAARVLLNDPPKSQLNSCIGAANRSGMEPVQLVMAWHKADRALATFDKGEDDDS